MGVLSRESDLDQSAELWRVAIRKKWTQGDPDWKGEDDGLGRL